MESCHLVAARRLKLWSLNANLFFKEPQQLTKFTQWVHLNKVWKRTFYFKDLVAVFLGLQSLWPYTLKKPDLGCSSGYVLSKTKSVTPPPHFLFAFLAKVDPTFLRSKFQKTCPWEHFGRERP